MKVNKFFDPSLPVTEQLEKIFVSGHTELKPYDKSGSDKNQRLYLGIRGTKLIVVLAAPDGSVVEEYNFADTRYHSAAQNRLTTLRGELIFRGYVGSKFDGVPLGDRAALLGQNLAIVRLSTLIWDFFLSNSHGSADDAIKASDLGDFPFTPNIPSYDTKGVFSIKGISVEVTSSFIYRRSSGKVGARYSIRNIVDTNSPSAPFTGELIIRRVFDDGKWLGSKALLREHEEFIYHWLRDLDKEKRRLDVNDETNAI